MIKSMVAFNNILLVALSKSLCPINRTEFSQCNHHLLFNSVNLSTSVFLCIIKLAQLRRKCFVDSVSIPQLQRGSTESWKCV